MLDIKDIRIGSLLLIEGRIIEVGKISGKSISWELHKDKFSIWNPFILISDKRIKPILLTEEILLSCEGITKNVYFEDRYNYDESNLYFSIEDNHWDEPCLDVFMGGHYLTCIEYVHELQDIVKVLMKEEIKIKLC